MKPNFVVAFLFLAGCASTPNSSIPAPSETAADPSPIVAAERAFAADGYERGVKASFLAFAAPDAIMFSPGPVNAHEILSAAPDPDPAKPRKHLVWWPLYAGIAQSGDLGFTTGPYAFDDDRQGFYFTVWKKQPGGAWKWVIDAGLKADASNAAAKGTPVKRLRANSVTPTTADDAFAAVTILEKEVAGDASTNFRTALSRFLGDDSRLHSQGPAPSTDASTRESVLAARPERADIIPLGGGASEAGDLAWTYGSATTSAGEGYYVRVWQRREEDWRILFDEYLPPAGQ
ncbi:MAG: hypothetical protein R3C60_04955 [Parvularculaceae bacterium]